tara:strand:- start:387 stop:1844 length:1458 start_codon:yes stop_codon:yes gene_type:complete
MHESYYWYDLETTGTDPRWDRIIQFAGIRTDMNLSQIADPDCFYVKLPDDTLPSPEATLVTGITPAIANAEGLSEWEAVSRISNILGEPKTCVVGYNNIRFDDEFIRNTLYRLLYDPYSREYQHANSRWDILTLARAARALRPDGVNWPEGADGLTTFRLEELSRENNLEHTNAHDALSDVRATISFAGLIQKTQPRLFSYFYHLRKKENLRPLLEPFGSKMLVHIASHYSRTRHYVAPIMSIARHPTNKNSIIVVDLSKDINPLFDLSVDELKSDLYGPNTRGLALNELRINRAPFVAELSVLTPENWSTLQLDRKLILERREALLEANLQSKLSEVFKGHEKRIESTDPDGALYEGFISNRDRRYCDKFIEQIHTGNWIDAEFDDPRLNVLAWRIKARNFEDILGDDEIERWRTHVGRKLSQPIAPWLTSGQFVSSWTKVRDSLKSRLGNSYQDTNEMAVLYELADYYNGVMVKYGIGDLIDH